MRCDFLSRTRLISIVIVIAMTWSWQDNAPSIAQDKKVVIPHAQDKPPNEPRDPQTAAKMMTVPEGFSVEVVAAEPDIVNPVAMTIDERGRFWITESLEYPRKAPGPGKDRVKILEDTDGDGKCDKFSIFLDGLNIPSGVAVGHGGVWIANSPDILFVPDADRDGKPDGPPQVVVTGFGRTDTHELPNSLTWGPDGWLYGLNGVFNYSKVTYPENSPWLKKLRESRATAVSAVPNGESNKGNTADTAVARGTPTEFTFTCAMFRIHPRTREFQVFAEGTSNPWGIAFNDEGEAFVSACVIDHLWHIVETGYYHRQGGPYPPFTWKIDSIVKHKHQKAAYCGIHYFDSDAYPEQYRGKLYMGNIHGGCINVDKLQRDGSTYFATGEPDFLTANDAWFMPVVQKTGPDGCLYILDWYDRYDCYQDANRDPAGIDRLKGRLYRVRYNGKLERKAERSQRSGEQSPSFVEDSSAFVRQESDKQRPEYNKQQDELAKRRNEALKQTAEEQKQESETVKQQNETFKQRHESVQKKDEHAKQRDEIIQQEVESSKTRQETIQLTKNLVQEGNQTNAKAGAAPKARLYPQIDLAKETDEQLIERLGANNDFIRWTATRLLQERNTASAATMAAKICDSKNTDSVKRHHSFFALAGMLETNPKLPESWSDYLKDDDPVISSFALRLLGDRRKLSAFDITAMTLALNDTRPSIQLQAAIALSKLRSQPNRGAIQVHDSSAGLFTELLTILHLGGSDKLIPHIVWQNLHPQLETHTEAFLRQLNQAALKSKAVADLMPRVVDRILGRQKFDAQPIGKLFALLRDDHPQVGREVLAVLAAKVQSGELKGDKLEQLKTAMFEPLTPLLDSGVSHPLGGDAALLAVSWGDPSALPHVRRSFTTAGLQPELRLKALNALIAAKDEGLLEVIAKVLDDKSQISNLKSENPNLKSEILSLKSQLLPALGRLDDPKVADVVLTRYANLEPELQPSAIELLTQRASWSKQLLSQVGEKKIAATAINVNQARRIQALKDKDLSALLSRHWGQVRDSRSPDRERVVAEMKALVRSQPGDPFAGEKVFKRVCAACHKIYGEGPDIGPDITSNGRNDFNQLLSNVFDPSLVIGAGYRVCTVVNKAGRVQSGLLVEDSPQRVVLKPAAIAASSLGLRPEPVGKDTEKKKAVGTESQPTVTVAVGKLEIIPRDDIDEFKINELSLMPEGLEKQLSQQEIVDLFAFLVLDKHPRDKSAKRLPGVN